MHWGIFSSISQETHMRNSTDLAHRSADAVGHSAAGAIDTAVNTGMAWWDLMLKLQRASLQSFSSYSPISDTRISGALPQRSAGVAVVPVGEERLNVATRTVQGETTRIRRRVVAQPVEQEVTLREETVVVERRAPQPGSAAAANGPRQDVLTETVVEMSDSRQVPTVWKSIHVAEEVVLRKQVTERTEKVRETVRRDLVEVEHDRGAAVSLARDSEHLEAVPMPRREPAEGRQHRPEPQLQRPAEALAELAGGGDARRSDEGQQDRKPGQGPQIASAPQQPGPGGRKA
jgi:uncharacterized protein (TIGR02271 family)